MLRAPREKEEPLPDRNPRRSAAEPTAEGGSAAGVRWDLSHLYASPDDPALEADLDGMLEDARRFAADYRGRVAGLDGAAIVAADAPAPR